jgi:hypothetical protein
VPGVGGARVQLRHMEATQVQEDPQLKAATVPL